VVHSGKCPCACGERRLGGAGGSKYDGGQRGSIYRLSKGDTHRKSVYKGLRMVKAKQRGEERAGWVLSCLFGARDGRESNRGGRREVTREDGDSGLFYIIIGATSALPWLPDVKERVQLLKRMAEWARRMYVHQDDELLCGEIRNGKEDIHME
jgi:hypothetical protein